VLMISDKGLFRAEACTLNDVPRQV